MERRSSVKTATRGDSYLDTSFVWKLHLPESDLGRRSPGLVDDERLSKGGTGSGSEPHLLTNGTKSIPDKTSKTFQTRYPHANPAGPMWRGGYSNQQAILPRPRSGLR